MDLETNEKHDAKEISIAVIGANGGIGRHTVELALQQGYHVLAIMRDPARLLLSHPNLECVKGDILEPGSLEKYLTNKHAVISAIGSNSLKRTTLYSQGNRTLLESLERSGIKRVFFISASGIEVNPTHSLFVRFATRNVLQKILKEMYADLERMEHMVKQSDSDWTIIRPPRLVEHPAIGKYRFAINKFLDSPMTISRADVAHYMIHNLFTTTIYKATVEVAY